MRRNILVSSASTIRRNMGLLEIETADRVARVPFREVGALVVESETSTMTAAAMSALMDSRSSVTVCGPNHMPIGMMLPVEGHCRQAELIESQIAIGEPLRKRLWKRIVKAKIENQARVLDALHLDSKPLRECARSVRSDDADNREGAAAAAYFRALAPDGGRRESAITAPLDYGYAILRGCIGRHAAAGGWLLSRGIKHRSQYNAFNLVDDLIEPFRPIVDLVVMANSMADPLELEDRRLLVQTLECLMTFEGKRLVVDTCAEEVMDSLRAAVTYGDASLLRLPVLDGLAYAEFE